MARLVKVNLCAYCKEWAWSFHASLVDLAGMGSIDSPTHTQKDSVESDLSTVKLFAQFTELWHCVHSQANIFVYRVDSHAGIAGNERAGAIAKYQASQANNSMADTGIPGAGPGGNHDAILFTPYNAKPTPSSSSHHVILLFTQCDTQQVQHPHRSNTITRGEQPHQLSVNRRHVHLVKITYCEDVRPGQQLEAAQRQHADLCKNVSGGAVTPSFWVLEDLLH
eukprot:1139049-Pelagomonas_calceolata.AAC.1